MKIAVLGGGIQGLSLAYFLSKLPGHSVTLFERGKNLGGLLGICEVNGAPIEGFYHHLANHDRDIIDLFKELGLADRLLYSTSKIGIFYGGQIYPFSAPKDLLRFKPLNLWQRIRVGLAALYLRNLKNYNNLENVSASRWLTKYMGRRAYEAIWEPLLRGKFGNHKDEVSMAWVWNRIAWRAKTRTSDDKEEQLVYPRGGFKILVDELEKRIVQNGGRIETGAEIEKIRNYEDGKIAIKVGNSERIFDKVVSTVPVGVFRRLVKGLPADYLSRLDRVKYRGAHVAVLVMDRPLVPGGYYWVSVNDRTMPMLAVVEHTNFVGRESYGGKTIVYIGNYPATEDPIMKMEPEAAIDFYCGYLPKINPEFKKEWIEKYFVFKDPHAQPVVTTGYREIMPPYETPIPNLYLLTMTQIYPQDRGANNAVAQSKKLVQKIFDI